MPDNKGKKTLKEKVILISGISWIAIAALGMLFDPEKYIIISSLLLLGTFIIIYYLFFRK